MFQTMFSEFHTSQQFQLGPDKLKYVINWGLAPFFFILSDESLNKSTQNYQMNIAIRFWSQEGKLVEGRYWDSQFLRHATSDDLLKNFSKSLVGLGL